jgi:hypothetical protein
MSDDTGKGACLQILREEDRDGLIHWRTHAGRNVEWTSALHQTWNSDCEYMRILPTHWDSPHSMKFTGSTSVLDVTCLFCLTGRLRI